MNILIDTHIALFSMYDDRKLNEKSAALLCDEKNIIFVSLISAWEIAIKTSLGKLDIPADEFLNDCTSMGYQLLPMKAPHIVTVSHMGKGPNEHKEPFDRMLLAQAKSEKMKFLTRDRKILQYPDQEIIQ